MNDLLAKAGSVFLAPAPVARSRARADVPPPDLVGVLAEPGDLPAVAGGVAADVRRRHRARVALVCESGPAPLARPCVRAARVLAERLVERGLDAAPAGVLCRVGLPEEPEAAVRDAWRAIAVAAGLPAVVAISAREEGLDGLLAHADLLLLATTEQTDATYAELALGSLAALGPPALRIRSPAGFLARRLAAAGRHPLVPEGVPV